METGGSSSGALVASTKGGVHMGTGEGSPEGSFVMAMGGEGSAITGGSFTSVTVCGLSGSTFSMGFGLGVLGFGGSGSGSSISCFGIVTTTLVGRDPDILGFIKSEDS